MKKNEIYINAYNEHLKQTVEENDKNYLYTDWITSEHERIINNFIWNIKQKTAIELIPENENYLKQKIDELKYTDYDIINLPHLTQRENWKTFLSPEQIIKIENLLPEDKNLILHLRTQDSKSIWEAIERIKNLLKNKIELLLVTGDVYTKNDELITTWKVLEDLNNWEWINISADLYLKNWWRFDEKIEFLKQNTESKIFTQPVFTYERIDELENKIKNFWLLKEKQDIFAWITWFSNLKQRNYWERINKVPSSELPNGNTDKAIKETSIARATEIYKELKNRWFSNYIMLMRENVDDLLKIQNKAENILY